MELGIVLIIAGLAVGILLSYGLGVLLVLVGFAFLIWPTLTSRRR